MAINLEGTSVLFQVTRSFILPKAEIKPCYPPVCNTNRFCTIRQLSNSSSCQGSFVPTVNLGPPIFHTHSLDYSSSYSHSLRRPARYRPIYGLSLCFITVDYYLKSKRWKCSVQQRKGPQGICFFLTTKISETWHTPHHFDKLLLPSEHSSNNEKYNVHCHSHKIIITGSLPITTGTDCVVSNKMSILPRSLYWEATDRNPMH